MKKRSSPSGELLALPTKKSKLKKDIGPSVPYLVRTSGPHSDGLPLLLAQDDGICNTPTADCVGLPVLREDNRTGVVFQHSSLHFDPNRKRMEHVSRIERVHEHLSKKKNLLARCHLMAEKRSCRPEDYLRVHHPGYMHRLDWLSTTDCQSQLNAEAEQFESMFFTKDSVREAKAAASSLCSLVSQVVSGDLDNGFAISRPPGHHAEPSSAGGYCIINNVAVAAAYARVTGVERVLIVDWDVHHGNGTQKCFYSDPNVLCFSVHRYDGGNYYPHLSNGGPSSVGVDKGKGKNINIGWNQTGIGDDEYLAAFEEVLMPVAKEFQPHLVLVSAGFDAAAGDIGECEVTPEGFARLTRRLMTLANGKLVCTLEGGYVKSVLSNCVESVLESLLDSESVKKSNEEHMALIKKFGNRNMLECINPSAASSIRKTAKIHSKFWKCLADF